MLNIKFRVIAVNGNSYSSRRSHDMDVVAMQVALDRFDGRMAEGDDACKVVGICTVGGNHFDRELAQSVEARLHQRLGCKMNALDPDLRDVSKTGADGVNCGKVGHAYAEAGGSIFTLCALKAVRTKGIA